MKTLVACPNSRSLIHTKFINSLLNMNLKDCHVHIEQAFPIHVNRENTIRDFINGAFTQLLWLDTDMVFPNDLLQRLEAHNKPIVSGLYNITQWPHWPIMNKEIPEKDDVVYKNYYSWPENQLIEVDTMGTGCLLIQREVLEKLNPPFFEYTRSKNDCFGYRGEDTFFFRKCREIGYKLFMDTSLKCGHLSEMVIDPDFARGPLKDAYILDQNKKRKELLDDGQD